MTARMKFRWQTFCDIAQKSSKTNCALVLPNLFEAEFKKGDPSGGESNTLAEDNYQPV